MRINNKKLKNRKKLLLDFVSNKEYQPMRAKDIAMQRKTIRTFSGSG